MDANLGRAAPHPLFLDRSQHVEGGRFGRADEAGAAAMRTRLCGSFDERWTQPLTRHFKQAKRADSAHLDTRTVALQRLLQPPLDRCLVAVLFHVNEVDDDQPSEVAQSKLPGDLFRRL